MKYKKIIIAGALLATTMSCSKNNDDATTSASSEENNEQGTAGASKKAAALKSDFDKKLKELELALASVVVKDEKLPAFDMTDKFVKAKEGETNTKYSFGAAAKFFADDSSKFAKDAITCIARTAFVTVKDACAESKVDEMLCVYDKDKTSTELTADGGSGDEYQNLYNTNYEYVRAQYYRLLVRTVSGDTRNINKLVAQIKTSNDKEALEKLRDSLTVEKLVPGTCKLTSTDLKMYPDKRLENCMSQAMLASYVGYDTAQIATQQQYITDAQSDTGKVNKAQGQYVGDGGFGYVSSRSNELPVYVESAYKSYEASFKYIISLMKKAINAKTEMIDAKSTKAGSKQ